MAFDYVITFLLICILKTKQCVIVIIIFVGLDWQGTTNTKQNLTSSYRRLYSTCYLQKKHKCQLVNSMKFAIQILYHYVVRKNSQVIPLHCILSFLHVIDEQYLLWTWKIMTIEWNKSLSKILNSIEKNYYSVQLLDTCHLFFFFSSIYSWKSKCSRSSHQWRNFIEIAIDAFLRRMMTNVNNK